MEDIEEKKVYCFICGLRFVKNILGKHLKGCERKFLAEEEKKLKQPKLSCPLPPPELQEVLKNDNCTDQKINLYNERALAKFKAQSQPACKVCKRCFNSEAIKQHEATCQVKPQTPSSDGESRPAYRRATSYDCSFRKPRVLMCAICGREFGLTSLKIHHPQCIEKFNNEEAKKEKEQRRGLPMMQEHFLRMMEQKLEDWTVDEIDQFNEQATRIYREKGLVKCTNCGRAFFVQSLEKHKKNCRLINGNISKQSCKLDKIEEPQEKPKDEPVGKPRVVMCHICGREFGTTSLKIHQPQCSEKFLNEERKKPNKADQRALPQLPPEMLQRYDLNSLSTWSSQQLDAYNKEVFQFYNTKALVPCPNCSRTFFPESLMKHIKGCKPKQGRSVSAPKQMVEPKQPPKEPRKPKVLFCYICGREFGLTSLKIHQAQCELRYRNEEAKKDIDQRKDLPAIPERYRQMVEDENWKQDDIQEFNNFMNELYKGTVLEKCYNCGRTFFAQSLVKHAKMCVKKDYPSPSKQTVMGGLKGESPNKSSSKSNELQRLPSKKHVVDHIVEEEQNEEDLEPSNVTSLEDLDRPFAKDKEKKQVQPSESSTPSLKRKETRKEPLPKFTKQPSATHLLLKAEESKAKEPEKKPQPKKEESKKEDPPTPKMSLKSPKSSTNLKSISSKNLFSGTKHQLIKEKQVKKEVEPLRASVVHPISQPEEIEKPKNIANGELPAAGEQVHPPAEPETGKAAPEERSTEQSDKPTDTHSPPAPDPNAENVKIQLIKCKFCERKFQKTRLDKHLGVCPKRVAEAPKKAQFFNAVANEAPTDVELEKCRKCHRRFAKDRIDKHYGICKGNLETETPRPKALQIETSETQPPKEASVEQVLEELVPCSKCNRKFRQDRLQKHQSICKVEPKKPVLVTKPQKPEKLQKAQKQLDRVDRSTKPLMQKQTIERQSKQPSKVDKLPAIEDKRTPSPSEEEPKEMAKLLVELKHKKKSPNEINEELEREVEQLRQTKTRFKEGKKPSDKTKLDRAKVNRTTVETRSTPQVQPSPIKRDSVHFPEI